MPVDTSMDVEGDAPAGTDRRARAAARRRAVEALGVLGSPRQERYDRMTRLACNMFDVAFATIAIADGDSFWVKSTFADWGREFALPQELFRAAMQADSTVVVPDLNADEFAGPLRAAVDGSIRFFAGAPLRNSQGIEIGAFCIGDRRVRTLDDGLLAVFGDLTEWVRREMITSSDSSRARALQQRLLPADPPRVPGYQLQAMCTRAGNVGGDFYDWQPAGGDRVAFMLADVVGKGTAAAIMSATVRGALRSAIADAVAASGENGPGLICPVARAADILRPDLQATGKFATAFVGMLSPAEHRLTWVDAGHGLAVLCSAGGSATWLGRGDPALGVGATASWTEHSAVFRPGDTLLVFSDGLFELGGTTVHSLADVQGLVSRVMTADRVIATLGELATGGVPTDDITAVALHRVAFPT